MAAVAMLAPACSSIRSASGPMRTVAEPARCAGPAPALLVMLPGAYTAPEEFAQEGFVAAVRHEGIAADVLLVDAHVGYYDNRTIVQRLAEDVLLPARAHGYARVWLVGISNGGAGAILAADRLPQAVDGIVLLAPYLGSRHIAEQVRRSGGLQQWQPSTPLDPANGDQVMWRWLKRQVAVPDSDAARRPVMPQLYLGYGLSDPFAFNHGALSPALPPSHVAITGGGHNWQTWRALWERILPRLPLERDASCTR